MLQHMHDNSRILSYHDLLKMWPSSSSSPPFKQFDVNCSLTDRYPTSWSVQRGHHFFLFKKGLRTNSKNSFHRHIQRTLGKSGDDSGDDYNNNNNTGINIVANIKTTQLSCTSLNADGHIQLGQQNNNSPSPINNDDSLIARHKTFDSTPSSSMEKSERVHRESQLYLSSYSSPSNQADLQGGVYQQRHRELQQRSLQGAGGPESAEVVDESSCGCSCFSFFFKSFKSNKQNVSDIYIYIIYCF
jgi:hypothetical protein